LLAKAVSPSIDLAAPSNYVAATEEKDMHRRLLTAVGCLTLGAVLSAPQRSEAQSQSVPNQQNGSHHHYKLIDIGTLGGPNSSFGVGGYVTRTINAQGTAIAQGDTTIPDPYSMVGFDFLVSHPLQLRNSVLTDLGALPGMNSSLASWINSQGWVAGFSENGNTDSQTGFPETAAVLWKDGRIIDLGTLGGSSSGANAINNHGQVVGGALNAIPDPFNATFQQQFIFETFPFYFFPFTTQSRAFLWQSGKMQDLGTLGGPDSVA
jgi:probable HAF family extracellular repeat protein